MASACVNNIGVSPENFLDCHPAKYPWLSPRISSGEELTGKEISSPSELPPAEETPESDEAETDLALPGDFEFRLDDPVNMLPADELFSDGKLVPLSLSSIRLAQATPDVKSPSSPKLRRRQEVADADSFLYSPKAPRCMMRWKELLGLKKLYHSSNSKGENHKTASSSAAPARVKQFVLRSPRPQNSSVNPPLVKDSDTESLSVSSSSRLSISSSSSGQENEDSERPNLVRSANQNNNNNAPSRSRVAKTRTPQSENSRVGRAPDMGPTTVLEASAGSPRMSSSGKIVFHGLERSSSSPSSYGGPRYKHSGVQRSYSANVRVNRVLNVPVCSLRGSSKSNVFGIPLFSSSQHRKEGSSSGGYKVCNIKNKNVTDRH